MLHQGGSYWRVDSWIQTFVPKFGFYGGQGISQDVICDVFIFSLVKSLWCWWLTVGSSHQHCHFQTSQPCTKIWETVWNQLGKQSSKSVYITRKNSALSFYFALLQRMCSGPGFNTYYPLFMPHKIVTWSLNAPLLCYLSVPRPGKM